MPHMKQTAARKTPAKGKPDFKSGLPGSAEEQRRGLRAAMERHAETLRRLAR